MRAGSGLGRASLSSPIVGARADDRLRVEPRFDALARKPTRAAFWCGSGFAQVIEIGPGGSLSRAACAGAEALQTDFSQEANARSAILKDCQ
jgi:hypothetical protein